MSNRVTLHGMWDQAEWRCAWEAALLFAKEDGHGRRGRSQTITYTFDALDNEIRIAVWRDKRGLNAVRVR